MNSKNFFILLLILLLTDCNKSEESVSTEESLEEECDTRPEYFKYFSELTSPNSIVHSGRNGVLISGSKGQYNAGLLNLNEENIKVWSKEYSSSVSNSSYIHINEITETENGFMAIGSETTSDINGVFVIDLNKQGKENWRRIHGDSIIDLGTDIIETRNKSYIISGNSVHPVIRGAIIKIDSSGMEEWSLIDTISPIKVVSEIFEMSEENFLVASFCYKSWDWYLNLQKIDKDGRILWDKDLFNLGSGHYNLRYNSTRIIIKESKNNSGYLVSTLFKKEDYTFSESDIFLGKIDNEGNILWSNTYGEDKFDRVRALLVVRDSYFIVGSSSRSDKRSDVLCLKVNTLGEKLWAKTYGCTQSDFGMDAITIGEEILITGYTAFSNNVNDSRTFIFKTDLDGNPIE